MKKTVFRDSYINGLKPKDKTYRETEGNGFYIRVTPQGKKAWLYRYYYAEKDHSITLGYYPAMSLGQARTAYQALFDLWQSGVDPKAHLAKLDEAKTNTVKKLVLGWYENYIQKERKQPQQIKQLIDADIIPLLGDIELAKLSPAIVTTALDKIVKRGARVHANKVLSALKQAFNYGVRRGALKENPAVLLQGRDIGGIEKPRDRYLTIDEIKTLLLFLDSDNSRMSLQTKLAIKIILHTGIRSGELRLATWSEIDYENSLWTIPKEHTKQDEIMRIHLTEPVKAMFKELQSGSKSNFVLSAKQDTPLSPKALSRAINRIQERVGIPHWTAHDLRRSFCTQLGETLHIDPVVIEKCLGHKMPKIMATYNRNEMLHQRKEALHKWSQYLNALLESNVVSIETNRLQKVLA
ncbi:tyrosine-type recombinase/integrase [Legionella fairfieldensis]|uniref:tyrosine-type recombinase/integrase n=1 Tax=Legionella fairfieldensis TaxID=45064 RepID=UPI0004900D59|nr:site-specific integrase [Legionella fairfieldensis]